MIPKLLALYFFIFAASSSPISSALKVCNLKSALDVCIKENLNVLIPSLTRGWEWLDIPGIEPFKLPATTAGYHDGNMTLDLNIKDIEISGLSDTHVLSVKSKSIEQGKLEVVAKTNKITATGEYISEGIMANLALHSQEEINTAWMVYLDIDNVSGKKIIQVVDLRLDFMPMEVYVEAAQSFDGSNELGNSLNLYLNDNSIELLNLIKPNLQQYFRGIFMEIINVLLQTSSSNDIFPGISINPP